jgi:ABC-2 type transport system ATP-binding protein
VTVSSLGPVPGLAVHQLTRRFGERQAVREVTFTLHPGELVAMIGPNGAGKTTLLSLLAGVLQPSSGSVQRPGERSIGWVPQQPALYRKLSVAENLRVFARLGRVADVQDAVARMLELTGLPDRAAEPVGRLSGGNQQRVNIAIGLLSDPVVLLLDEPSAGLDPRQRERLWEFVGGLAAAGTAVLYSTHDMPEALRHADRLLVLDEGELRYDGAPREWQF